MYKIESLMYIERKRARSRLLAQFSHDNKVFCAIYGMTILAMEYSSLGYRDWFGGHLMLLILLIGYFSAQKWIGKNE